MKPFPSKVKAVINMRLESPVKTKAVPEDPKQTFLLMYRYLRPVHPAKASSSILVRLSGR